MHLSTRKHLLWKFNPQNLSSSTVCRVSTRYGLTSQISDSGRRNNQQVCDDEVRKDQQINKREEFIRFGFVCHLPWSARATVSVLFELQDVLNWPQKSSRKSLKNYFSSLFCVNKFFYHNKKIDINTSHKYFTKNCPLVTFDCAGGLDRRLTPTKCHRDDLKVDPLWLGESDCNRHNKNRVKKYEIQ